MPGPAIIWTLHGGIEAVRCEDCLAVDLERGKGPKLLDYLLPVVVGVLLLASCIVAWSTVAALRGSGAEVAAVEMYTSAAGSLWQDIAKLGTGFDGLFAALAVLAGVVTVSLEMTTQRSLTLAQQSRSQDGRAVDLRAEIDRMRLARFALVQFAIVSFLATLALGLALSGVARRELLPALLSAALSAWMFNEAVRLFGVADSSPWAQSVLRRMEQRRESERKRELRESGRVKIALAKLSLVPAVTAVGAVVAASLSVEDGAGAASLFVAAIMVSVVGLVGIVLGASVFYVSAGRLGAAFVAIPLSAVVILTILFEGVVAYAKNETLFLVTGVVLVALWIIAAMGVVGLGALRDLARTMDGPIRMMEWIDQKFDRHRSGKRRAGDSGARRR